MQLVCGCHVQGLGAKQNHILEKSGNEYICHYDGFELQVRTNTMMVIMLLANVACLTLEQSILLFVPSRL